MNQIKRIELHNTLYHSKANSKKEKQAELLNILVNKFNCLDDSLQIKNITSILGEKVFNRYY